MKKIKVGISGAQSTGKTTFITSIENELKRRLIKFKTVSDLALTCPLPINRQNTVESCLWIAANCIANEIDAESKFEVILTDRSILDSWAYFASVYTEKYDIENPKVKTLLSVIANWSHTYDLIFQTVIDKEIPIEDDNRRDLDENFRDKIGAEMIRAFERFSVKYHPLTVKNKNDVFKYILTQIEFSLNGNSDKLV